MSFFWVDKVSLIYLHDVLSIVIDAIHYLFRHVFYYHLIIPIIIRFILGKIQVILIIDDLSDNSWLRRAFGLIRAYAAITLHSLALYFILLKSPPLLDACNDIAVTHYFRIIAYYTSSIEINIDLTVWLFYDACYEYWLQFIWWHSKQRDCLFAPLAVTKVERCYINLS